MKQLEFGMPFKAVEDRLNENEVKTMLERLMFNHALKASGELKLAAFPVDLIWVKVINGWRQKVINDSGEKALLGVDLDSGNAYLLEFSEQINENFVWDENLQIQTEKHCYQAVPEKRIQIQTN